MFNPAIISQAPTSVIYGNGFAAYKHIEPVTPLNALADPYSLVSEKRKMLMQLSVQNKNQLGNKMEAGGGPQTAQGSINEAAANAPRKSLMDNDDYKKMGGVLADFFVPPDNQPLTAVAIAHPRPPVDPPGFFL